MNNFHCLLYSAGNTSLVPTSETVVVHEKCGCRCTVNQRTCQTYNMIFNKDYCRCDCPGPIPICPQSREVKLIRLTFFPFNFLNDVMLWVRRCLQRVRITLALAHFFLIFCVDVFTCKQVRGLNPTAQVSRIPVCPG